MKPISYKRHRFPADVIRQAVWLYFRYTLSLRDVEDLLAERGIEVSYQTIRCGTRKFGQLFGQNLRRSRSKPTGRWHLDEMVVKIGGRRMYLWRAIDDEGEVLDVLVQKRRNKAAGCCQTKSIWARFALAAFPISGSSHRFLEQTQGETRRRGILPIQLPALQGVNFDTKRHWSENTGDAPRFPAGCEDHRNGWRRAAARIRCAHRRNSSSKTNSFGSDCDG